MAEKLLEYNAQSKRVREVRQDEHRLRELEERVAVMHAARIGGVADDVLTFDW